MMHWSLWDLWSLPKSYYYELVELINEEAREAELR